VHADAVTAAKLKAAAAVLAATPRHAGLLTACLLPYCTALPDHLTLLVVTITFNIKVLMKPHHK
jgi:hypothetical protein